MGKRIRSSEVGDAAAQERGGARIGIVISVHRGRAKIRFACGGTRIARATIALDLSAVGREVLCITTENDEAVVTGLVREPDDSAAAVVVDGEALRITGSRSVELVCGDARIVLRRDGRVEIRGRYVLFKASETLQGLAPSIGFN